MSSQRRKKGINTSNGSQDARNDGPASPRSGNKNTKITKKDSFSSSKESLSSSGSSSDGNIMFERALWISMNLVGKMVEVQVKSGEFYEGILHTACPDKGFPVILKMARKKDNSSNKTFAKPIENFVINSSDFVQLYAKDVSISLEHSRSEFATDSEISGFGNLKERELQPWVPDSDTNVDLSLDGRPGSEWDQFQANKDLFGVESTWDENLYTVPLDKRSEFYKDRQHYAERIAEEIEREARGASNIHLLEERLTDLNQLENFDEEDRYGAVIRDSSKATVSGKSAPIPVSSSGGKYVPPQRRSKEPSAKESKVPPLVVEQPQSANQTDSGPSSPVMQEVIDKTLVRSPSQSPRSPRGTSPLLSMSPSKQEIQSTIAERMRLRMHLVGEKYKNSAPVPTTKPDFPETANRSPLLSPLVGDARGLNALALDPSTPNVPEQVVQEFIDYSLHTGKKPEAQSERMKIISELKNFSKSIEKKVAPKTETPAEAKPSETKPKTETATNANSTDSAIPSTTTTSPASTTTTTKKEEKSKLNPNAKVFKPMSANAPSFTPTPVVAQVVPDPYMYAQAPRGQPMYPPMYPMGPMIPNQPVYPQPMMNQPIRVVPQGSAPFVPMGMPGYPPQAVVYAPPTTGQPPHKVVPAVPYMTPGAMPIPSQRVMVPPQPGYYPGQVMVPPDAYGVVSPNGSPQPARQFHAPNETGNTPDKKTPKDHQ